MTVTTLIPILQLQTALNESGKILNVLPKVQRTTHTQPQSKNPAQARPHKRLKSETFAKPTTAWIGVDLDGTLAVYDGWKGIEYIGDAIPAMLNRVKEWIDNGQQVKIFTARASDEKAIPFVKEWLKNNGLPDLEITNIKDFNMIQLWDDRAIQVIENTGTSTQSSFYNDFSKAFESDLQRFKIPKPEPEQADRPLPIKFQLNDLPIAIENQAGTVRRGIDKDGHEWAIQLQDHYGEIQLVNSKDGDYIDCFVNPDYDNFNEDLVFIVNQIDSHTGEFDEHKVMLGYNDENEAEQAYLRNYKDGWQGLGSMIEYDYPEFKRWLKDDN